LILPEPLSGELAADREAVYAGLREGRCHLVYDSQAPGAAYHYWAENSAGLATAGEDLPYREGTTLCVACGREDALHRLVQDGETVGIAEGPRATFPAPVPGAYRLETSLYWRRQGSWRLRVRPWVFTNPIYLGGPPLVTPAGDR